MAPFSAPFSRNGATPWMRLVPQLPSPLECLTNGNRASLLVKPCHNRCRASPGDPVSNRAGVSIHCFAKQSQFLSYRFLLMGLRAGDCARERGGSAGSRGGPGALDEGLDEDLLGDTLRLEVVENGLLPRVRRGGRALGVASSGGGPRFAWGWTWFLHFQDGMRVQEVGLVLR